MIEQIQVRDLTDLQTLQGVPSGDNDLGAFTGSVITDNSTIKTALQELETELEQPFSKSLDDLSDVTYNGAPAVGEMLTWEAVNGWVNKQALSINIGTDTTNFNNNLSAADDTVQKALDTLDNLSIGSTASSISTVTTNFDGILSAADTNVQLALETIDDIDYANGTAYANHVADGTIHYTQAAISIPASQISDFDTEVSNNTSVATNTTHVTSDGKSHSDVVSNNTHRTSTGEDHSFINQSVVTTATPTFANAILSGKTSGSIPFFGAGGVISEDNSNLFWDDINDRLLVGINSGTSFGESFWAYGNRSRFGDGLGTPYLWGNPATGGVFQIGQSSGSGRVSIVSSAQAELFTVLNGGNVGIGIINPLARLHVKGSGVGEIQIGEWIANNVYGAISLNGSLSATNYNILSSPSDKNLFINRPAGYEIKFRENGVEQVTINSGGNVGIGDTTPSYKLDVNGTFRAVGASQFDSTLVVGDHGTASTDQVVNVCYGTSATPPTASTTTEGALYIQYTA